MINIQQALKVASKFLSNDKIQQAVEMSKNVRNPQDAIKVLSKLGDPNKIINDGLGRLNSPMAKKVASMFGANEQQLESLRSEILGMKGAIPTKDQSSSRLQDLMNGLK